MSSSATGILRRAVEFAGLRLDVVEEPRQPSPTATVVLRDVTGAPCAWGWVSGADQWVRFPGLATFRFGTATSAVTAFKEDGSELRQIHAEFKASVAPLVLQAAHGFEVLHGSGVLVPRLGVIAFCAPSRTGKSTIALGLSSLSQPIWADDLIALRPQPAVATTALALPFEQRLTAEARAYFAERDDAATAQVEAGREERLSAVCILERTDIDVGVEVFTLSHGEALAALLQHAYEFIPGPVDRKRLMVRRYLEICSLIPVFRVRFTPGLARLPDVLAAIRDSVMPDS